MPRFSRIEKILPIRPWPRHRRYWAGRRYDSCGENGGRAPSSGARPAEVCVQFGGHERVPCRRRSRSSRDVLQHRRRCAADTAADRPDGDDIAAATDRSVTIGRRTRSARRADRATWCSPSALAAQCAKRFPRHMTYTAKRPTAAGLPLPRRRAPRLPSQRRIRLPPTRWRGSIGRTCGSREMASRAQSRRRGAAANQRPKSATATLRRAPRTSVIVR